MGRLTQPIGCRASLRRSRVPNNISKNPLDQLGRPSQHQLRPSPCMSMFHVMSLHHSFNFHSGGAGHSRSPQAPEKIDAGRLCALVLRVPSLFRRGLPSLTHLFISALSCVRPSSDLAASVDMFDRYIIEPLHLARIVTYLPIPGAQKPVKSAPTYLSPAPNGRVRVPYPAGSRGPGSLAHARCDSFCACAPATCGRGTLHWDAPKLTASSHARY